MAIISVPAGMGIADTVFCTICGEQIALELATAGFRDANDEQAFACNEHFRSGGQYIIGWVDFVASERRAVLYNEENMSNQGGGVSNVAWALY
jgi:hypothetical protein